MILVNKPLCIKYDHEYNETRARLKEKKKRIASKYCHSRER